MKQNINEVMHERQKTIQQENEYIFGPDPITYFPYTHGDSLELAREKLREQACKEMQLKRIVIQDKER